MDHALPILFMLDSIHEPLDAEAFTDEKPIENCTSLLDQIRKEGCEVNMKPCDLVLANVALE